MVKMKSSRRKSTSEGDHLPELEGLFSQEIQSGRFRDIEAIPLRFSLRRIRLLENNREIALLRRTLIGDAGTFALEGSTYRTFQIRQTPPVNRQLALEDNEGHVASLESSCKTPARYTLQYDDGIFTFRQAGFAFRLFARSYSSRAYILTDAERVIGAVDFRRTKSGFWGGTIRRKAIGHLPESVPLPVQIFLIVEVLTRVR